MILAISGELLQTLTEAAGAPRASNHQIRALGINALSRANFQDQEITRLSGHKDIKSLENYRSGTLLGKMKAAIALQQVVSILIKNFEILAVSAKNQLTLCQMPN